MLYEKMWSPRAITYKIYKIMKLIMNIYVIRVILFINDASITNFTILFGNKSIYARFQFNTFH